MREIKLLMALFFFLLQPQWFPLQSSFQLQDRDPFTDFENSIRVLCKEGENFDRA